MPHLLQGTNAEERFERHAKVFWFVHKVEEISLFLFLNAKIVENSANALSS